MIANLLVILIIAALINAVPVRNYLGLTPEESHLLLGDYNEDTGNPEEIVSTVNLPAPTDFLRLHGNAALREAYERNYPPEYLRNLFDLHADVNSPESISLLSKLVGRKELALLQEFARQSVKLSEEQHEKLMMEAVNVNSPEIVDTIFQLAPTGPGSAVKIFSIMRKIIPTVCLENQKEVLNTLIDNHRYYFPPQLVKSCVKSAALKFSIGTLDVIIRRTPVFLLDEDILYSIMPYPTAVNVLVWLHGKISFSNLSGRVMKFALEKNSKELAIAMVPGLRNFEKDDALQVAVITDNMPLIYELLDHGAIPSEKLIGDAAYKGHFEMVSAFYYANGKITDVVLARASPSIKPKIERLIGKGGCCSWFRD